MYIMNILFLLINLASNKFYKKYLKYNFCEIYERDKKI